MPVPSRLACPPRLAPLLPAEEVTIDVEPLGAMRRRLGRSGAEAAASRALDAITGLLCALDEPEAIMNPDALARDAAALAAISEEVGLPALTRAAAHLADAAERCDPAAMGATLARLLRVGQASLEALWEGQG